MKKTRITILLFSALLFSPGTRAQEPLIMNTLNRQAASLNGTWRVIIDPLETGYYDYRYQPLDQREHPGDDAFFTESAPVKRWDRVEYDFETSPTLVVPADWNSQDEKLLLYEGTVWYKKSFDYVKSAAFNRVFIWFGAANYRADVYLNGEKLGSHTGGFTPFNFEVTGLLKTDGNYLVVKVDNKRHLDAVPTSNFDWWNYGGLTRDVKIIETPETFIRDYFIQLDPENSSRITGYVQADGRSARSRIITLSIPGLGVNEKLLTGKGGRAEFSLKVKKLRAWAPEDPQLYEVKISSGDEVVCDRIGFRTISTKGDDILLNGKEIFLKGICIHAENPFKPGRATGLEDAKLLLGWAKELGCNFVRLAHYPHSEHMLRLADEMGIMVWEENPVYWTINWENPDTYTNAENQLTEVIHRDKNRASVIIWSMANETPLSAPRLEFLTNLATHARSLDNTRLISAALEKHYIEDRENTLTINDPFAEVVDVVSFNQYVGWYDGLPDKCDKISWDIPIDKPIIVSEFGGGALHGFHGDSLTRWSEEYQAWLYRESLGMLDLIPQLSGTTPWILVDFRSPKRNLPYIQDWWNRKGIISSNGQKKQAWHVLRKYYERK